MDVSKYSNAEYVNFLTARSNAESVVMTFEAYYGKPEEDDRVVVGRLVAHPSFVRRMIEALEKQLAKVEIAKAVAGEDNTGGELKGGWLERHIASAEHDFRTWPRWMLDAAGIRGIKQTETERLAAVVAEKDAALVRLRGQYSELILAVESKHDGETRHQTALRYIRERETRTTSAAALRGKRGE